MGNEKETIKRSKCGKNNTNKKGVGNMKKILLILSLFISIAPSYAEFDYAYEATNAYHTCIRTNTKCDEAKRYVNEGINYYANKKSSSYENLKNYCRLLYLRTNATSWGDMEQWQKDMFNLKRSCSF